MAPQLQTGFVGLCGLGTRAAARVPGRQGGLPRPGVCLQRCESAVGDEQMMYKPPYRGAQHGAGGSWHRSLVLWCATRARCCCHQSILSVACVTMGWACACATVLGDTYMCEIGTVRHSQCPQETTRCPPPPALPNRKIVSVAGVHTHSRQGMYGL